MSSDATSSMIASGAQSTSRVMTASATAVTGARSREVCTLRFDVDRVQRLARGHEQPVAARTAEADVGAGFRQANESEAGAVGREHLHAGPRARPDVAVHVAANAVGRRPLAVLRVVELHEAL